MNAIPQLFNQQQEPWELILIFNNKSFYRNSFHCPLLNHIFVVAISADIPNSNKFFPFFRQHILTITFLTIHWQLKVSNQISITSAFIRFCKNALLQIICQELLFPPILLIPKHSQKNISRVCIYDILNNNTITLSIRPNFNNRRYYKICPFCRILNHMSRIAIPNNIPDPY